MNISIDNNKFITSDINKIKVHLSEDVEIIIQVNKFGEMVITKVQFGAESGDLMVFPSVSNQIRIK